MLNRLLVPTDGSDISIAGALRAVPLAKMAGASITVLRAGHLFLHRHRRDQRCGFACLHGRRTRARHLSHRAHHRCGGGDGRVPIDSLVVEDHQAAKGIVDAAQSCGADLIVMGSHGRSGLAKMVLGSVAAKVLAMSPVPVFIIK